MTDEIVAYVGDPDLHDRSARRSDDDLPLRSALDAQLEPWLI
jgi:hypothetical protein